MASSRGSLSRYRAKRDFSKTPEPPGRKGKKSGYRYLIQKHAATRLHYDFRLELDGVLKSWAVTKGPSLDPHERRLAVEVEDHPLDYGEFEGIIPKGQYGGGTVMLWDEGTWEPLEDPHVGLEKGKLAFLLHGERLQGEWALVRMHTPQEKTRHNWLLIKKDDDYARPGDAGKFLTDNMSSVISGRSMEAIAADQDKVWQSKPREKEPPSNVLTFSKRPGGNDPMPPFIPPQLATLASAMPQGGRWVHEIKFDGYRMQAHVNRGIVKLLTRNGKDWTEKFEPIADLLGALPVQSAILDGEMVALDESGASSFGELQEALTTGDQMRLQYYLFDLLYLNGENLTNLSLLERKKRLQPLLRLKEFSGRIIYSEHFGERDQHFFQQVCRLRLEGVVSKLADAPYRPGRGKEWLKAKCHQRQEFVIGGFTLPTTGGPGVGALLLGYFQDDDLLYAGRVGTGFTSDVSVDVRRKLNRLKQKTSSFLRVPADGRRGALWVKPQLVAEVEFSEWTRDGRLRHPSFQGLREDKDARSIKREVPVPVSEAIKTEPEKKPAPAAKTTRRGKDTVAVGGVAISHPDRIIYPEEGLTKLQLAEYYLDIADRILPHIKERPLSMVRCPEGSGEPCFFQRHIARGQSASLHEAPVTVKDRTEIYLMIKDLEGLLSLVQWGVIEMHPWGCRADRPDLPDRMIFDLDPDPTADFKHVVEGAFEIRDRMTELGLTSFLKTTGGKGLHVTIPMERAYPWATVKAFARAVAQSMEQDRPERYTTNLSKAARKGRIFIDYLRNELTATSVAPFSARARPGATIATPLAWEELTPDLDPSQFNLQTMPERLKRLKKDPWQEFFKIRQKIAAEHLRALHIAAG
jgi:bifunctional non-homologous end joining protein LigD